MTSDASAGPSTNRRPPARETFDLAGSSLSATGRRVGSTVRASRRLIRPLIRHARARRASGTETPTIIDPEAAKTTTVGSPAAAAAATEQLVLAARDVFEELGATYIKVGQLVASAPSLAGEDVARHFRSTLDAGPPVPYDEVVREIELAAGAPLHHVFQSLDREPIGQASLAVVHRGVLVDGTDVAVKILRPGIEQNLAADIALLRVLVAGLRVASPASAGLLSGLFADLRTQLGNELDLRNEASMMAHFRSLPKHDSLDLIAIPRPYPECSGRRVLVMEFLDGVAIDGADFAELDIDPAAVVDQALKAWFFTALRDGLFHGDVHAGNFLVLRDGRVGMIDWGIVGTLEPKAHWVLRRFIGGAIGDETAWAELADYVADRVRATAPDVAIDRAVLAVVLREQLSAALTRPFGEFSLAELLLSIDAQGDAIRGEPTPTPSFAERVRSLRNPPATESILDGGILLLAKQLAYFERYGKLHLSGLPVLTDRDFFVWVLSQSNPHTAA